MRLATTVATRDAPAVTRPNLTTASVSSHVSDRVRSWLSDLIRSDHIYTHCELNITDSD